MIIVGRKGDFGAHDTVYKDKMYVWLKHIFNYRDRQPKGNIWSSTTSRDGWIQTPLPATQTQMTTARANVSQDLTHSGPKGPESELVQLSRLSLPMEKLKLWTEKGLPRPEGKQERKQY